MKTKNNYFVYILSLPLLIVLFGGCTLNENDEVIRPQSVPDKQVDLLDKDKQQDGNITYSVKENPFTVRKRKDDKNNTYTLTLDTDCVDGCSDWNTCSKDFGCALQARVTFQGHTRTINLKTPGSVNLTFTSNNPKDPLHLWVGVAVLFPPFKTIYDKTVPINYCYGPQLDYNLRFHYRGGFIPKMYFKHNDISCLQ